MPSTTTASAVWRRAILARSSRYRSLSSSYPNSKVAISSHPPPISRSAICDATAPTAQRKFTTSPTAASPSTTAYETSEAASSSGLPASTDLLEVYRGLCAQGKLRWDEEQVRIVIKLKHLLEELEEYEPPLDLLAQLPDSPFSLDRRRSRFWTTQEGGKERMKWVRSLLGPVKGQKDADVLGLIRVLSGEEELENLTTPKGILITGPPGTGKSLLLSLFFNALPTTHKRRAHYHSFTLSLYRKVFLEMERRRSGVKDGDREGRMEVVGKRGWRAVFAGGRWEGEEDGGIDKGGREEDTIPFVVARDMILEYHILYFDELQLLDASSASLLRDVLSWYWRLGGVIVSCSNRVPDDLYHHGVQRERMSSFLSALKARCDVVELDGGRDWRHGLNPEGEREVVATRWFASGDQGFELAWQDVCGSEGAAPASAELSVYGRRVQVPLAAGKACRFSFNDLCEQPLGPADYLSLTSAFSTIFIDEVPVLLLKHKNEARRLINLVDALYEARCQVQIRAQSDLSTLFFPDALGSTSDPDGDGNASNESIMAAESLSETLHAPARPNVSVYNPFEREKREKTDREDRGGVWGKLGIFTGEDERFAYKRAVSRLVEMTTSPTYRREGWIPLDAGGRTWEKRHSPGDTAVQPPSYVWARGGSSPTAPADIDDLAVEAGYSRPSRLTPPVESSPAAQELDPSAERLMEDPLGEKARRAPPLIQEHHVWGVTEEWGNKAGKWGQGSKAYSKASDGRRSKKDEGGK